ncbi:MAG TPA: MvdD family ATP-grasp ribosomal peptide maturase [Candidatus Xenobia bacterium]|jgi:glutathione synthase/RimK-type ligase-like ATP-grasp enzyme
MSILLVTHSKDPGAHEVAQALRQRGAVPARLDTDLYPLQVRITTTWQAGHSGGWLVNGDGRFPLAEMDTIWYRRFYAGRELPLALGEARRTCIEESRKTLFGTLAAMTALTIDPVRRVVYAEHKELQLKLAATLGFDIPRTLFSNDAEAVRQFYQELDGQVICKMQSGPGFGHLVFTSKLKANDLSGLDDLKYSPMTFQETIAKRLELRATVIGRRVFTASVDSQQFDTSSLDWRRDPDSVRHSWAPYPLPADVEKRLLDLTAALGLNYGAADFIVTPEGRHVFLEINPGGEFMWLTRNPGLPLVDAMADLFSGRAERLPYQPLL